ncbi:MAG: TonB-dependent receptor plug domain-containing protein, partial [Propionibacteriaceae bacterium]|nr:TonB-dependent receptor plug domain-containing protein [Propionibacteriaceae bacterium]
DYALRPHSTTQEILNNVPGLTVVQHQGGGKAVQYLIRGFDADHGTDFALFTDGIPVNMVTHGHGQGYADLNYLIPETVSNLQLFKGPYFVELGDFSLAGALKITTKDEFRESFALAEGGSFDTQRYVLGGSVPVPWGKTLLAAEVYNSNGPFENPQNYWRYNGFGKVTITQAADQKLQFLGSVYSGDWDGSGQIPARVVGSQPGDISRFGSLDPSEGGHTDRENLSMLWSYDPGDGASWTGQLWGSRYHLRLFSDFSFFQNTGLRFYTMPGSNQVIDRCAGLGVTCPQAPNPSIPNAQYVPGDGIEQTDTRLLFGGFLQYNRFYSVGGVPWLGNVPMQSELGISTRRDQIDVSLRNQVRRNPYFTVNDVGVGEQSLSGWWGQQIFLTDWARLEGGVRGDVFFFNVGNHLPQQGLDPNFESVYIDGTN